MGKDYPLPNLIETRIAIQDAAAVLVDLVAVEHRQLLGVRDLVEVMAAATTQQRAACEDLETFRIEAKRYRRRTLAWTLVFVCIGFIALGCLTYPALQRIATFEGNISHMETKTLAAMEEEQLRNSKSLDELIRRYDAGVSLIRSEDTENRAVLARALAQIGQANILMTDQYKAALIEISKNNDAARQDIIAKGNRRILDMQAEIDSLKKQLASRGAK